MSGEHTHPEYDQQEDVSRLADWLTSLGHAIADLEVRVAALEDTPPDPEPSFPGAPPEGKMYWGAILQNMTASALEAKHGDAGLHRTYWQWAETGQGGPNAASPSLDQTIARGWLPVISFKTPKWREVANGQHNAQLDKWLNLLKSKGVPIWLIAYHEPEDNLEVGSFKDYLDMQTFIRNRMTTLGVTNVALGLCLMGYTWNKYAKYPDTGQLRKPDDWWNANAPTTFDFLAVDTYSINLDDPVMKAQEDWASDKGVPLVIGEWGYVKDQHGAPRSWTGADVRAFYERQYANGTLACLVYDADGNGWFYDMPADQDAAFKALLKDPRTYHPNT